MAHVPFVTQDAFGSELLSAVETACHSIVAATQVRRAYLFKSWVAFTTSLSQDPHLSHVPPSLHLDWFIVYTCRYHHRLLSQSVHPIRAKCMEEAL